MEIPYIFRVLFVEKGPTKGPPKDIPFVIEKGVSPYDFCTQFIRDKGAHSIDQAELVGPDDKILMYYQPWRGWYFGDKRDKTFSR